jgi:hypothetical protein
MSILVWIWLHLLGVFEAAATALGATFALYRPEFGSGCARFIECSFRALAYRRGLSVLSVGMFALGIRLALLPIAPVPEPGYHDEFANLLIADTLASGRLANPTHPMWQHFETMHVTHQPAYAGMYPPGNALALAAGQVFGHPFIGVLLSVGAMCAALCWMLQGWFTPGWALLGGFLVVLRLGTFSYWANSYLGGAVAAIGGALVLGALPRLLSAPRVRPAAALGVGIVVLLNTRLYEGAILSATALGIPTVSVFRRRGAYKEYLRRVGLPLAGILVLAGAAMAYYNWRAFGSATTLPYELNRRTYAVAPVFAWQHEQQQPAYRHAAMRDFFTHWELDHFRWVTTPAGFSQFLVTRVARFWVFYLGPALTIPFLFLPAFVRDRQTRLLALIGAVLGLAMLPELWFMPHYCAPATAIVLAVVVDGTRRLNGWCLKGKPVGGAIMRCVLLACLIGLGARIVMGIAPLPFSLTYEDSWGTSTHIPLHRERIIAMLRSFPGPHLVIVRYASRHDPFYEYVFNAADIDRAEIVWARDMGVARNSELVRYFHGRRVWLLEPDASPLVLQPYQTK